MAKRVTVNKSNGYDRVVDCPPDKSISIRALLMCGLSHGMTVINNILRSADTMSAMKCVSALGGVVTSRMPISKRRKFAFGNGVLPPFATLFGVGDKIKNNLVDCGNSATAARLIMGLLAGRKGEFVIDGDRSLRNRPMLRVIEPLRLMGADITDTNGCLPVTVRGKSLHGIDYVMPVNSAQVKSAILLAGLSADGETRVTELIKTRDHTEKLIEYLGGDITVNGNTVTVRNSELADNNRIDVTGDISSAAYPICAALGLGGCCTVKNVGINPTRTRYIEILRASGANISFLAEETKPFTNEPSCYIVVRKSELKPFAISGEDVAKTIDEIPVMCALACLINGRSVIDDAGELRFKESDRISSTVSALKSLGADITETQNGIVINGGKQLSHGVVDPHGDHRIAMAAAIAGACGQGAVITNADCTDISYPDFFDEVLK